MGHFHADRFIAAAQVQIALRERDFDIVFDEGIPDIEQNFADDVPASVLRVVDPEPDFKIDRVVTKTAHQGIGPRIVLHACAFCRRLITQLDRKVGIAVIGNADRDFQAQLDVRVAPVFNLIRDQVFVRDQEFCAITGSNRGVTRAQ